MAYYPNNFYGNYQYNQYPAPQPQAVNQAPAAAALSGKIVENIEMAKVTDIPFGGYGIFPKADMSEIYIKTWNSNGTTNIMTFSPMPIEQTQEGKEQNIINRIEALEQKFESIVNKKEVVPTQRKELNVNAY